MFIIMKETNSNFILNCDDWRIFGGGGVVVGIVVVIVVYLNKFILFPSNIRS